MEAKPVGELAPELFVDDLESWTCTSRLFVSKVVKEIHTFALGSCSNVDIRIRSDYFEAMCAHRDDKKFEGRSPEVLFLPEFEVALQVPPLAVIGAVVEEFRAEATFHPRVTLVADPKCILENAGEVRDSASIFGSVYEKRSVSEVNKRSFKSGSPFWNLWLRSRYRDDWVKFLFAWINIPWAYLLSSEPTNFTVVSVSFPGRSKVAFDGWNEAHVVEG